MELNIELKIIFIHINLFKYKNNGLYYSNGKLQ